MSWGMTAELVDHQLGMHIVHLEDDIYKSQHKLQICIGKDSCPLCGHVIPKTNTGLLDPRALTAAEIAALEQVKANIDGYAKRHNVRVRRRR
jgi:hypothetical protein